jgi:AcrR family transcriptional regulator
MASPIRSPQLADPGAEAREGRRRILDQAAGLFLERGYAATSLRHIAAAAGMKAGSLYYHFSSKEALLEAILLRGIEVMVEAFHRASASSRGRDGETRLVTHVRAHLGALFEHGPYTAAHVTTFRTAPPAVRAAIVPARDAYEALWTDLLAELASRGELAADAPIGLSRLILFGAMNSAIEWFDVERGSLDAFARAIGRQFWSGLSGTSAARGPDGSA